MRSLVRRYITAEQRKRDDIGITEDDVMEIRQDISSLRFELIDILGTNGMKTPHINPNDFSCERLDRKIFVFVSNCDDCFVVVFMSTFVWPIRLVAGKKGKMMERRILKDFQIGIVETLVNEAVRETTAPKDVFSSIAKAINKGGSSKYFVEHCHGI